MISMRLVNGERERDGESKSVFLLYWCFVCEPEVVAGVLPFL